MSVSTCAPTSATSRSCCGFWRTTTNPASPLASASKPRWPRPWPSPPCPVEPCGTKDSSRADASARRSSCRGGPTSSRTTTLADWYRRLLTTVTERDIKQGRWQLLESTGWPDNPSCDNLLAWSWSGGDAGHVVVVNFSAHPAQARIHLDLDGGSAAADLRFTDLLTAGVYLRDGSEIAELGLYVELQPWESYLFALDRLSVRPDVVVTH